MPFQNGTCSSLVGLLAGEVEIGLKWQYLPAACDFLGHADVLFKSVAESLRQSIVAGYVITAADEPLSPCWTQQQFSATDFCIAAVGGPLSPRWSRQQLSAPDFCVAAVCGPLSPRWTRQEFSAPDLCVAAVGGPLSLTGLGSNLA